MIGVGKGLIQYNKLIANLRYDVWALGLAELGKEAGGVPHRLGAHGSVRHVAGTLPLQRGGPDRRAGPLLFRREMTTC